MKNKKNHSSRRRWYELIMLLAAIVWIISIYSQLSNNSIGSRRPFSRITGKDLVLTDGELSPILTALEPEVSGRMVLLFFTRGREFDDIIIEFLNYVADSLPTQLSVNVISPKGIAISEILHSKLNYHEDIGAIWSKFLGSKSSTLENGIIMLNRSFEQTFVKYNITKREIALLVTNQAIPREMENCSQGELSTKLLQVYSLTDSTEVTITPPTFLVFFPSICSDCGEDALLKSIEMRIANSDDPQDLNTPRFLFPYSTDHQALRPIRG